MLPSGLGEWSGGCPSSSSRRSAFRRTWPTAAARSYGPSSRRRSAAPAASAPSASSRRSRRRRRQRAGAGPLLRRRHAVQDRHDGPPYAVEWIDENPFERRELSVEVEDNLGNKGRDKVVLEAFEIIEVSEVASVLLEAGVYDRKGQFVSGLKPTQFVVSEDGVAQAIDLVNHERVPATFALLIDSSQSMSRRFDFVKDAASRLTAFLRPQDRVVVAPFSKRLAALTGPTGDRRTIIEAIQHIEPTGGTAILDTLDRAERAPAAAAKIAGR